MNHIYRVVFNHATGVYQCVSEFAKAHGKTKSVKSLSVAVGLLMGGQALAADIEFNDAKTHTFDQAIALNGDVLIGNDTTITVNNNKQIQFGSPNTAGEDKPTTANISNSTLNSGGIVIANTQQATVNIDNSKLNLTGASAIGVQKSGIANISNNTKITTTGVTSIGYEAEGKMDLTGSEIDATNNNINIGERATGELNLKDKAKITAGEVLVGIQTNHIGTLTLDDSQIDTRDIAIGDDGVAIVTLTNGSSINTSEHMHFGRRENGRATINVTNSSLSGGNELNVGQKGVATLNAKDSKIASNKWLRVGLEENSSGTVVLDNSTMNATDEIIVGWDGAGDVTLNNKSSISSKGIAIGLSKGAGKITLNDDAKLTVSNILQVGGESKGELIVNGSDSKNIVVTADIVIVGTSANSDSMITANNKTTFQVNGDMIIGAGSKGTVTLNKNSPYSHGVGHTYVKGKVYLGGFENLDPTLNTINGTGSLILIDSTLRADEIVVGNVGKGILQVESKDVGNHWSGLYTNQISRGTNATQSDVFINGAELSITENQPNLFANFTKNDKIEIGNRGVHINTESYLSSQSQPTDVIINPNAVITGDVGHFGYRANEDDILGGFIHFGTGTLEIAESSKKFTGDIGSFAGTLKINGNYTMNGENLIIGILDTDDNNVIDDNEHGKVVVTGTADISNGNLNVYAQDLIKPLITGNNPTAEYKDVLTAGTLKGKFKDVQIFDVNGDKIDTRLGADYSDANKVHLKIQPENTTPVVPPTPNIVGTFENAVNSQNKNSLLNLAQVLDTHKDTNTNPLGLALTLGASGLDNAKLTQGASELAPLMHGSTAHVIANAQDYAFGAIHARHLDRSRSVWAKAIGTQGKLQENELLDYDTTDIGAIVGADTAVGRGNIGLALSYIHSDVDSRGNARHDATVKSTQVLGYGDYDINDRVSVHATVGVGRADIDGKRHISTLTAGNTATATADYTADTAQAGFEIRHRFGTDTRRITPFIGMKYTHVSSDGYTETGAGVYNLAVQKASFNEISQNFGIRLQQAISPRTTITGELSGSVYGGERTPITASFVNADDSAFTLNGQELGRTAGNVGLGMTYKPTTNTTLSLGYQGQWRKNYDNQGAALGFEMKF